MREILFRGKTKFGKWIFGDLLKGRFDDDVYIVCDLIMNRVIPETVGQFTGLCDDPKGGDICTRIFEGDIVSGLFLYSEPILGVVEFQDGAFGLAWQRGSSKEFSPFPCMCNVNYEVVGNVTDNPELLGAER